MRSILNKLFRFSLMVFISFFIFILILLSPYGTPLFFKCIPHLIPGKLEIHHVKGTIDSHFILKNIHYSNNNTDIEMGVLDFSWNPKELIQKKIAIKWLNIQDIKIKMGDPKSNKNHKKFNLKDFKWLNLFTIDQLNINHLNLDYQNKISKIDKLQFNNIGHHIHFLRLESNFGKIYGKVYLVKPPHLTWQLILSCSNLDFSYFTNYQLRLNGNIESDGSWNAKQKKIAMNVAKLHGEMNKIPLSGSFQFKYVNGNGKIENAEFDLGTAKINFSGTFDQDWKINWNLSVPNLNELLPQSNGAMNGLGTMTGSRNSPLMTGTLRINAFSLNDLKFQQGNIHFSSQFPLHQTALNIHLDQIQFKDSLIQNLDAETHSQLSADKLSSSVSLKVGQNNQINGTIVLPQFQSYSFAQPILGNAHFDIQKIEEFIAQLPNQRASRANKRNPGLKYLKHLHGHLFGDVNLSGFLDQPQIALKLNLNEGSLSIPKLGTKIDAIQLSSEANMNQPMMIKGQFKAGEGLGYINGEADLTNLKFNFNLTGKNLQIVNLKSYKINATPDIHISYFQHETTINGHILLPSVVVSTNNIENVIFLPKEVIFVDDEKTETNIPNNLSMNVQIILGDHVSLSYNNLHANLSGQVLVSEAFGSPFIGTGELLIHNGIYKAYGQTLKISRGRLIYTGNDLLNPGLDVEASKKIKSIAVKNNDSQFFNSSPLETTYLGTNKITVGIHVKGVLDNPIVSLFSDPSGLNRNDILSYLVFGYPSSEISGSSSLMLLNDLTASDDGKNINGITNNIKSKLGLKRLSLQSTEYFDPNKNETGRTTALTVSKKLRKNLIIQYSVGLFHPISILSLRYKINKHLTLKTESSTVENGADLVYQIERDG